MSIKILWFILLCSFSESLAQSYQFQKQFHIGLVNEECSINTCPDSGNLVAWVNKATQNSGFRFSYSKFDKQGNHQWTKIFATVGQDVEIGPPTIISDGGYFFSGQIFANNNKSDALAMKIDSAGTVQWCKMIGDSTLNYALLSIELRDKGFLMIGGTDSVGTTRDFYVVKLNSQGELIFAKYYGNSLRYDSGQAVAEASNHDLYLGGSTRAQFLPEQFYLMKTDPSGNLLWAKTYGGNIYEYLYNIKSTIDNGCIMIGISASFSGTNYASDGLIIKVDSSGKVEWSKTYKVPGYYEMDDCVEFPNGDLLISGGSPNSLMKLDLQGNLLWYKYYNSAVGSYCCVNRNYDISQIAISNSYNGLVLQRTDSSGNSCNQHSASVVINNVTLNIQNMNPLSGDLGTIKDYPITYGTYPTTITSGCSLTSLSNHDNPENNIHVTPNPSTGRIKISSDQIMNYPVNMVIYNTYGQKLGVQTIENEDSFVDLHYPNGLYILSISTNEKSSIASRIAIINN